MATDGSKAVSALLSQTEAAHGAYETAELNGVHDEDWPRWYAEYAVEHGIGALIGHPVTTGELALFLATSFGEYQRIEPKSSEPWAAYTARRITTDL